MECGSAGQFSKPQAETKYGYVSVCLEYVRNFIFILKEFGEKYKPHPSPCEINRSKYVLLLHSGTFFFLPSFTLLLNPFQFD